MEICQIKNTYCYYIYVTKNFLDRTLDNESTLPMVIITIWSILSLLRIILRYGNLTYPILLKHSGVHLTNIDEPIYTRIRQVIYPEDIAEIGLESIYTRA